MSKAIRAIFFSVAMLCAVLSQAEPVKYAVDPVHSLVLYRIIHLGIAPSYGVFTGISGEVVFDPADLNACQAKIQVDPLTLNSFHSGRDQHLKGPEFLNVDEHFSITFESKAWKAVPEKPNCYEVEGILNFLGVSKPITAEVVHGGFATGKNGEQKTGFEVTFSFKRSEFGMTAYLPDALSDEVRITVALEANRK